MESSATIKPTQWSRARFYTIHGRQLPSVTTILDVIAKPALGPWYAKEERRYFEAAATTDDDGETDAAERLVGLAED